MPAMRSDAVQATYHAPRVPPRHEKWEWSLTLTGDSRFGETLIPVVRTSETRSLSLRSGARARARRIHYEFGEELGS